MFSPHDLLPLPEPRNSEYPAEFFYDNVAKYLIKDTVRIMMNGVPIDMGKVAELEEVVKNVVNKVTETIANNAVVKRFHNYKYPKIKEAYEAEITSKMKSFEDMYKPYKHGDMTFRSYYMKAFIEDHPEILPPLDEIVEGVAKWSVKDVKNMLLTYPELECVIAKQGPSETDKYVIAACKYRAEDKVRIYNKSYEAKLADVSIETIMPKFNPASSTMKIELFEWLNIESSKFSKKTDLPTWDRDEIERVLYETEDEDLKELLQAFIDHSFAAIILNNFIKAFYEYTIDGVLYGNYKLLGAKSARYTSNSPNLLNMPSTGSIYAKPLKKCFTAPEGYLIYAIDYSALNMMLQHELTYDENKQMIVSYSNNVKSSGVLSSNR